MTTVTHKPCLLFIFWQNHGNDLSKWLISSSTWPSEVVINSC